MSNLSINYLILDSAYMIPGTIYQPMPLPPVNYIGHNLLPPPPAAQYPPYYGYLSSPPGISNYQLPNTQYSSNNNNFNSNNYPPHYDQGYSSYSGSNPYTPPPYNPMYPPNKAHFANF